VRHPAVQKLASLGSEGRLPQNFARDLWRFAAQSIALLRCLQVHILNMNSLRVLNNNYSLVPIDFYQELGK
jgi:hypothetical protein